MAAIDTPVALTPLVVCDAGPLIHLDQLGCLNLLSDFSNILVPDEVWMEVTHHRPAALINPTVQLQRVRPSGTFRPELQAICHLLSLHRGEIEALQIAAENSDCILLTDDTAARLAAGNLGLQVHGTIGVLLRAIRRGLRSRDEVLTILRSITSNSTLHIRKALLEEIIRDVESSH